MGVATDAAVAAARRALGRDYHWLDWELCAADLGLTVVERLDLMAPAYLLGRLIVIRADLPPHVRAWYAWEEIAHHLTVAGNREHWRRALPGLQGELTLARFERLARDVRAVLPAWDVPLP